MSEKPRHTRHGSYRGHLIFIALAALPISAASESEIIDAAKTGNLDKVTMLLRDKPELVKDTDEAGKTALHFAQNKQIAAVLLQSGAELECKTKKGATPLFGAVFNKHFDVVGFLVSKGADVNAKGDQNFTPLHLAARYADKEIVRLLLDNCSDVNAQALKGGGTPLSQAVPQGDLEIIKLLWEHGAKIDLGDVYGATPLHVAAFAGKKEIAQFLVEKGADVNAKDVHGWQPIHRAAFFGRDEIVTLFLSKGVDVNAKDNTGKTPLHVTRTASMARLLLSHGAEVNVTTTKDASLHKTDFDGESVIELFVSLNPDEQLPLETGVTPLHLAAANGNKDLVSVLLDHGADTAAKTKKGKTALDWAIEQGKTDIQKLLEKHGK
jgi:ankyrin repeat protein